MMTEPSYFADDTNEHSELESTEDGRRGNAVGLGGVFTSGYLPGNARLSNASELGGYSPADGPSREAFEWGHDAAVAAPVDDVADEVAHLAGEPPADEDARDDDDLDFPRRTLARTEPVNRWTMA